MACVSKYFELLVLVPRSELIISITVTNNFFLPIWIEIFQIFFCFWSAYKFMDVILIYFLRFSFSNYSFPSEVIAEACPNQKSTIKTKSFSQIAPWIIIPRSPTNPTKSLFKQKFSIFVSDLFIVSSKHQEENLAAKNTLIVRL